MSAKTSEATLKAIAKNQSKNDLVRFWIRGGAKKEIAKHAKAQGFNGIQPYIKKLIEDDSGLEL